MALERAKQVQGSKIFVFHHLVLKIKPFYPHLLTLWINFLSTPEQLSFTPANVNLLMWSCAWLFEDVLYMTMQQLNTAMGQRFHAPPRLQAGSHA